jgi:hypothetical protein
MIVCPASLFVSWFIARQSHRLVSTIGWENVGFEMTVVTEWDFFINVLNMVKIVWGLHSDTVAFKQRQVKKNIYDDEIMVIYI